MIYSKLTLADTVYSINAIDITIKEHNIIGIELVPCFVGPQEMLSLSESVLILKMSAGTRSHAFKLDDEGNILDEDSIYFFSLQEAEEECVILRTNENRAERDMDV
ncbi:MAG TPA: hypothetical protein DGG95_18080 [Cytophagales bacterium]|jgi:hypothetical protein|nr:hypothetical protein [Cytophagales bacterium]